VGEGVIVLDTSFLIDYFRNESLRDLPPERKKTCVTVITYYEIMAGIRQLL
jgi:predicted nucleic acid-binding protein